MGEPQEELAYCAVRPGWPGYVAVWAGEDPTESPESRKESSKWRSKDIGDWLRRGWSIVRATRHDAAIGIHLYADEKKRRKPEEMDVVEKTERTHKSRNTNTQRSAYEKAMRGE